MKRPDRRAGRRRLWWRGGTRNAGGRTPPATSSAADSGAATGASATSTTTSSPSLKVSCSCSKPPQNPKGGKPVAPFRAGKCHLFTDYGSFRNQNYLNSAPNFMSLEFDLCSADDKQAFDLAKYSSDA